MRNYLLALARRLLRRAAMRVSRCAAHGGKPLTTRTPRLRLAPVATAPRAQGRRPLSTALLATLLPLFLSAPAYAQQPAAEPAPQKRCGGWFDFTVPAGFEAGDGSGTHYAAYGMALDVLTGVREADPVELFQRGNPLADTPPRQAGPAVWLATRETSGHYGQSGYTTYGMRRTGDVAVFATLDIGPSLSPIQMPRAVAADLVRAVLADYVPDQQRGYCLARGAIRRAPARAWDTFNTHFSNGEVSIEFLTSNDARTNYVFGEQPNVKPRRVAGLDGEQWMKEVSYPGSAGGPSYTERQIMWRSRPAVHSWQKYLDPRKAHVYVKVSGRDPASATAAFEAFVTSLAIRKP